MKEMDVLLPIKKLSIETILDPDPLKLFEYTSCGGLYYIHLGPY